MLLSNNISVILWGSAYNDGENWSNQRKPRPATSH